MPSIFQPINVYNTHDDSAEREIEQENQDVSSATQTKPNQLTLRDSPDHYINTTIPTFHNQDSIKKETIVVNADLPIESKEQNQSFGEKPLHTKFISPTSEKNDSPIRPFAKT